MQNYLDIKNKEPTIIIDDKSKEVVTHLNGEIEFRNVSFSYPNRPEKKILDNVDIKFLKNKKNALVAESGQGKSTVM